MAVRKSIVRGSAPLAPMRFEVRSVRQLRITDEKAFARLPIYAELKSILRESDYTFRLLPAPNWDRALLLNLAFWNADAGGDVLSGSRIEADVVAHVTWHMLAARALGRPGAGQSVRAMFLGESIASAFDVYLIGHLMRVAPESAFLASQVPSLAQAAQQAGVTARGFESLLRQIVADPEGAFHDLRALLMEATTALYACKDAEAGLDALSALRAHRFAPLLHHYELATWVLHARAHGQARADKRADRVHNALLAQDAMTWLRRNWIAPATAEIAAAAQAQRRPAAVRRGEARS